MKTRFFIAFLVVLAMVMAIVPRPAVAQDGGSDSPIVEALLTQLRTAYATTAEQTSYLVTTQETISQFTSIRRYQSGTYLMDVTIYESYVNTQTFETAVEATVIPEGVSATFEMNINQVQGLGYEYVRDGVVLASPEDTEDELELLLQLVQADGETYINTDETGAEFRDGIPEGWRPLLADGMPILSDATITGEQVSYIVDGLYFASNNATMQNLLQVGVVSNIDVLEDGDIEGLPVRRYRISFDGEAALSVLGLDYNQVISDLVAASELALPEAAPDVQVSYDIDIAVGSDTNLIYEQVITLTINGLFSSSTDNAAYTLSQTNTKSYSGFGETYTIEPVSDIAG